MKKNEEVGLKFKDDKGQDWIASLGDDCYEEVKKRYEDGEENPIISSDIIFGERRMEKEKGYDWQTAAKKLKENLSGYTFFSKPKTFGNDMEFPEDLTVLNSKQLGQLMSRLEAYRSFVNSQIAFLDVDRGMTKSVFEIGLGKVMSTLERMAPKRRLKETLQADALINNHRLKLVKQKLIELEAQYQALVRLVDIYTGQIFTISREMSRRQGFEGRGD